jgi:hypothetical protein
LQDEIHDDLIPIATAVFADDSLRSGTFHHKVDLTKQLEFWDSSLQETLGKINLISNPQKKEVLVSSFDRKLLTDVFRNSQNNRVVSSLKYLGGYLTFNADITLEINARIHAALAAWASMGAFWNRSSIATHFKRNIYLALVQSSLLTELEALPYTIIALQRLEKKQCSCLRRLMCGQACRRYLQPYGQHNSVLRYQVMTNVDIRKSLQVHSQTLTVHLTSDLSALWRLVKRDLFKTGAKRFQGVLPRGPPIRGLQAFMQQYYGANSLTTIELFWLL